MDFSKNLALILPEKINKVKNEMIYRKYKKEMSESFLTRLSKELFPEKQQRDVSVVLRLSKIQPKQKKITKSNLLYWFGEGYSRESINEVAIYFAKGIIPFITSEILEIIYLTEKRFGRSLPDNILRCAPSSNLINLMEKYNIPVDKTFIDTRIFKRFNSKAEHIKIRSYAALVHTLRDINSFNLLLTEIAYFKGRMIENLKIWEFVEILRGFYYEINPPKHYEIPLILAGFKTMGVPFARIHSLNAGNNIPKFYTALVSSAGERLIACLDAQV